MLSPFVPFISEELHSRLPQTKNSVHVSSWPTTISNIPDVGVSGDLIIDVAQRVRSWKANTGMALNEQITNVDIYVSGDLSFDTSDLSAAINAPISLKSGKPDLNLVPSGIEIDYSLIGPLFREKANSVVSAIKELPLDEIKSQLDKNGTLSLLIDNSEILIDQNAITIEEEYQTDEGKEINVIAAEHATILISI